MQGHGTVVTGSVTSGSVAVGDEVEWLPRGERVRVRSLQNHDQPVEEVHRGMRAAHQPGGRSSRGGPARPGAGDARLPGAGARRHGPAALPRRRCAGRSSTALPVRFHLGTAEIMGDVSLLDCDAVEPGEWGLAQLFLEEPATATWGQPFVVRGSSATQTLGGGQVLQPVAKKIRRRHVEMLERIERLWTGDADERVLTVAWFGGFAGFTAADLVRGANIAPDQAAGLVAALKELGKLVEVVISPARRLLLHADMVRELDERILQVLARLHAQFPLHGLA